MRAYTWLHEDGRRLNGALAVESPPNVKGGGGCEARPAVVKARAKPKMGCWAGD
jgi:hypothetical protein